MVGYGTVSRRAIAHQLYLSAASQLSPQVVITTEDLSRIKSKSLTRFCLPFTITKQL